MNDTYVYTYAMCHGGARVISTGIYIYVMCIYRRYIKFILQDTKER